MTLWSISRHRIEWTRYARRGNARVPADRNGFLQVSASATDDATAPHPVTDLDDPIVLLLGEPGMGKTDVASQWAKASSEVCFLRAELLDAHRPPPTLAPGQRAPLIVDALDEHPNGVGAAIEILKGWGRFDDDAPRIWMTCRSASWTQEHTATLPADRLGIWTIAPLREEDVRRSVEASDRRLDPDRFLETIRAQGLERFAHRPLTLDLLLDLYGRAALPNERTALYTLACARMCNDDPRTLLVASRIAAWMVFTQSTTVGRGAPLKPRQIVGREPLLDVGLDRQGEVTIADVEQVLGESPLLNRRDGVARWEHASFAEFLAARYLALVTQRETARRSDVVAADGIDPRWAALRIESLFAHPQGGLVPQLTEVATWLGSLLDDDAAEARRVLIDLDPVAQLQGDLQLRSDEDKARVARGLLARVDEGHGDRRADTEHFWKLRNPGLANLLRRYITDSEQDWVARRTAVDIASNAKVEATYPSLVSLVTAHDERYHLRTLAGWALLACDSPEHIAGMRLLLDDPGDDPDDDLRGLALLALWRSDQMGVAEVFAHLGHRRRPNYAGALCHLMTVLAEGVDDWLTPETFAAASRWLQSPKPAVYRGRHGSHIDFYLERIRKAVLSAGVRRLGNPAFGTAFKRLLSDFESLHFRTVREVLEEHPERWPDFVRLCAEVGVQPRRLLFNLRMSLIDLAACLRGSADQVTFDYLNALLDLHGVEAEMHGSVELLDLYLTDPSRFARFRHLHFVELGTEEARTAEDRWKQREQWRAELDARVAERANEESEEEAREQQFRDVMANPLPAIESWLQPLREGKAEYFPSLVYSLMFGGDERPDRIRDWRQGIDRLPGWRKVDDDTRLEIVEHARRYLDEDPETDAWFSKNSTTERVIAGAAALHLLANTGHGDDLTPEIWRRWAPAVVRRYSAVNDVMRTAIRQHATDTLVRLFTERIAQAQMDVANVTGDFRYLQQEWPTIASLVAEGLLFCDETSITKRGLAGEFLLSLDPSKLAEVISLAAPVKDADWLVLIGCALRVLPAELWPTVKQRAFSLPEARFVNLVGYATGSHRSHNFLGKLTTNDVGELLAWFVEHHGDSSTPSGFISGFQPEMFITTIIYVLKTRIEPESIQALRAAGRRWAADEVEAKLLANTWQPLTPADFARYLAEPTAIRISTAEQLRQWIFEVTRRAFAGPAGAGLWHRLRDDRWRPANPDRIIDCARHALDTATVIGNRVRARLSAQALQIEVTPDTPDRGAPLIRRVDVRPNFHDPPEALFSLPKTADLLLIPWFDGPSWSLSQDRARRARALQHHPTDCHRILSDKGAVFPVAPADSHAALRRALPWLPALEAHLAAEEVQLDEWVSIGDAGRWLLRLQLPARLVDRFGLSRRVTAVAMPERVDEMTVRLARRELAHAPSDVDFDLLLVIAPDADRFAARSSAGLRQLVPLQAPDFEPFEVRLARYLPNFDVFDFRDPVRGARLLERDAEVIQLTRMIEAGKWIMLAGLRKVGKTSLARGVEDRLSPAVGLARMHCVRIDLQTVQRTEAALAERLARELGFTPVTTFDAFRDRLMAQLAEGVRICVMFDECDLFAAHTEGGAWWPNLITLWGGLRAAADEHPGQLSIVFIGRRLERLNATMIDALPNPILSRATHHLVAPFDRDATGRVLRHLGRRVVIEFDESTIAAAYDWTGGHVMLLRLWGSVALRLCRAGGVNTTAALDVDDLIDGWYDNGDTRTILKETLDLLRSAHPRAYALLEGLASDAPWARAALADRRSEHHYGLRRFGLLLKDPRRVPRLLPTFLRSYGVGLESST